MLQKLTELSLGIHAHGASSFFNIVYEMFHCIFVSTCTSVFIAEVWWPLRPQHTILHFLCVWSLCVFYPPPPPHTHTHTRLPTIESVFWSALFACSFFPQSFTSSDVNIRNTKCSFLCCKQSFDVTVNILHFHADLCILFLCAVLFTLI